LSVPFLVLAALLLAVERGFYLFASRSSASFARICAASPGGAAIGEPTAVVERLFYVFKLIQLGVFMGWLWVHGGGDPFGIAAPWPALLLGTALVVVGQGLNFSVFWSLGRSGVFYGNRFGHDVPWVESFPFSICPHPQYTGTAISIWGFFLIARYPHPDWIALPALETIYYLIAARYEGSRTSQARTASTAQR